MAQRAPRYLASLDSEPGLQDGIPLAHPLLHGTVVAPAVGSRALPGHISSNMKPLEGQSHSKPGPVRCSPLTTRRTALTGMGSDCIGSMCNGPECTTGQVVAADTAQPWRSLCTGACENCVVLTLLFLLPPVATLCAGACRNCSCVVRTRRQHVAKATTQRPAAAAARGAPRRMKRRRVSAP